MWCFKAFGEAWERSGENKLLHPHAENAAKDEEAWMGWFVINVIEGIEKYPSIFKDLCKTLG